jgi:hypothetical protein
LRSPKYRHAQIAPYKKLFSIAAQHKPTFVDVAGFRIENVTSVKFPTMPSHTPHDYEANYGRAFPIAGTFMTAFRQFSGVETRFDFSDECPVLLGDPDRSTSLVGSVIVGFPQADG